MESIYLDYNATTPMLDSVRDVMHRIEREVYGNPSSRHALGRKAWSVVEHAREQVADRADAHPDDVVFCSGATEANFMALTGRFQSLIDEGKSPKDIRVAISAIEHPCVIECKEWMQKQGAHVETIPVLANGTVDISFFDENHWHIISVMAANHETGAIQPIHEITQRLDTSTTYIHSDAAQWCGRFRGGLQTWGVDAMTVSAHKIYGPKGIGALIRRRGKSIIPMMPGSQEGGMRAGTTNVPAIAGFGEAAAHSSQSMANETERLRELRELLWDSLSNATTGLIRTVSPDIATVNTLHIRFTGMKAERVVDSLDRLGIACSSGPACASGASDASPVLKAMGLDEAATWEGVRFSLGHFSTRDEVLEAARRISEWHESQARCIA